MQAPLRNLEEEEDYKEAQKMRSRKRMNKTMLNIPINFNSMRLKRMRSFFKIDIINI